MANIGLLWDGLKKVKDAIKAKDKKKKKYGYEKTRGGQSEAGKEAAEALEQEGTDYASADEE